MSFAGRLEQELRAAGAVVHRLPSPRASRPLMIWRARRAFMATAEEGGAGCDDVPQRLAARDVRGDRARRRRAHLSSGSISRLPAPAWPDRWARFVRPDFAVFNSEFTAGASRVSRRARPRHPLPGRRTPCRSPCDRARRFARRSAPRDDDVVVLMAARFERWKGHEVLLEAAKLLPDVHADCASGLPAAQPGAGARLRDRAGRRRSAPRRPGVACSASATTCRP